MTFRYKMNTYNVWIGTTHPKKDYMKRLKKKNFE